MYLFMPVNSIFWFMEWYKDISKIPSVKTFDSNSLYTVHNETRILNLALSNVQIFVLEMYAI